ncbi:hypothetical protein RHS01_09381 [Rhizoctonia solani]|uniref:Uncharacterized protein n=1 Tax=Rhizoctonia solani TaxID=456999 RepID=A0A8H7LY28_9AGAM|nr:hypothetical protein RHS01_09381 [Rhizoctonia solani]
MCGHETSNEIVGKLAVRLCNDCSAQHLVETWTYAGWQNGPYPIPDLVFLPDSGLVLPAPDMVLAYPEGTKSRDPTEFHFDQRYERSGDPESEVMIATGEIAEYYSYDYVNPNYLNSAAIDQGCGFPTDLHEEDPVEFTSIQYSTNEPNKNHGPYFIFD